MNSKVRVRQYFVIILEGMFMALVNFEYCCYSSQSLDYYPSLD